MMYPLIFILATATLLVLFLIKIRAMQKNPEKYLTLLEKSTEWYSVQPEALERTFKKTTDSVVKPTLHRALVLVFAVYKKISIWISTFVRKVFYKLLFYSLKRGDEKKKDETQ